jgi:hypothetical protein
MVNITSPTDGASVSGTMVSIVADASDDVGVTQVAFSVDGSSVGTDTNGTDGWSVTWDSTQVADGGHTIAATARDTALQTRTDSIGVTVDNFVPPPPPPPTVIHVSDLDGSSADAGKGKWTATVIVEINDADGASVSGALVEGSWAGGASGSGSCTTNASGTCQVAKNARNRDASASFTIVNVTQSGSTYDAGANSDPDGDSDGTTIVVSKDGGGSVPPPPPPSGAAMHIGDLDGSSAAAPRNRWDASVDVLVHDSDTEAALGNMTVSGSFSSGGGGNCTTASNGRCTITRSNIKGNVASTVFTVTGVTDSNTTPTYLYDSGANHDPDSDSSGTVITIAAP